MKFLSSNEGGPIQSILQIDGWFALTTSQSNELIERFLKTQTVDLFDLAAFLQLSGLNLAALLANPLRRMSSLDPDLICCISNMNRIARLRAMPPHLAKRKEATL
jgi:hypothetical protein